jgi:broad specificity phosphatase PhoE
VELILVRHAQPAWVSPDGRNRNDPALTDLGLAQAQRVADRLADTEDLPGRGDVDRLFVSPARRAQETAAPIAAALDLPVTTHDWLVELKSPDTWEGAPIEEIEAAFSAFGRASRDEWWDGHPEGESLRAFHHRVTSGLRQLLAELGITPADQHGLWDLAGPAADGAVDRIVAVAHGGTNSAIIAHLLGAEPEPWEWDRFAMGHASVAVLATKSMAGHHIWSLRSLGDANHLAVPDRTF